MTKTRSLSKRILTVLLALALTLAMTPAMSWIGQQTEGNGIHLGAFSSTTANAQTMQDYNTASVTNETLGRIGQNGTNNIRQYFFHGAPIEDENDGIMDVNHVYANTYNYDYSISTDIDKKDY